LFYFNDEDDKMVVLIVLCVFFSTN